MRQGEDIYPRFAGRVQAARPCPSSVKVNGAETEEQRAPPPTPPPPTTPAHPHPTPQMPEEEAFCVFVRLMQEYRLRELFKPSMAELGLCIYQFEYMLQVSRLRAAPTQSSMLALTHGCSTTPVSD